MGNYIGIWLDEKLAIGYARVEIIVDRDHWAFLDYLRAQGYPATTHKGYGNLGSDKETCIMTLPKKRLKSLENDISKFHMEPFVTIIPVITTFGETYQNFKTIV